MRSHLATLPLPPKRKTEHQLQLGDRTESDSSSTHWEPEKLAGYGLREKPKRSVKASDPEFFDAGSVVVQDRESETESTQNPTRRRSKRPCQRPCGSHTPVGFVKSESATESTPVSSVSDASQDEEVALCLMMLSRDVWVRRVITEDNSVESAELKTWPSTTRGRKFKCLGCKKIFRTNRALAGHKAISKECQQEVKYGEDQKIYECPFCYKVFGSGQALGGHKRSHLLGSSTNNTNVASTNTNNDNDNNISTNVDKVGDTCSFILDLNLPAPVEDDEDHSYIDFH